MEIGAGWTHSAEMPFIAPYTMPAAGILAEAVTFDPGVVVAALLLVVLAGLAGGAVVVTGIAAGYLSGRDADRQRAAAAWRLCVVVEVLAVVVTLATFAPIEIHLWVWAALASSIAAYCVGRAVRDAAA